MADRSGTEDGSERSGKPKAPASKQAAQDPPTVSTEVDQQGGGPLGHRKPKAPPAVAAAEPSTVRPGSAAPILETDGAAATTTADTTPDVTGSDAGAAPVVSTATIADAGTPTSAGDDFSDGANSSAAHPVDVEPSEQTRITFPNELDGKSSDRPASAETHAATE